MLNISTISLQNLPWDSATWKPGCLGLFWSQKSLAVHFWGLLSQKSADPGTERCHISSKITTYEAQIHQNTLSLWPLLKNLKQCAPTCLLVGWIKHVSKQAPYKTCNWSCGTPALQASHPWPTYHKTLRASSLPVQLLSGAQAGPSQWRWRNTNACRKSALK